jgi:hypothetical protein
MHVERVSWLIIYKLWIMNTFGHFLVGHSCGAGYWIFELCGWEGKGLQDSLAVHGWRIA